MDSGNFHEMPAYWAGIRATPTAIYTIQPVFQREEPAPMSCSQYQSLVKTRTTRIAAVLARYYHMSTCCQTEFKLYGLIFAQDLDTHHPQAPYRIGALLTVSVCCMSHRQNVGTLRSEGRGVPTVLRDFVLCHVQTRAGMSPQSDSPVGSLGICNVRLGAEQ